VTIARILLAVLLALVLLAVGSAAGAERENPRAAARGFLAAARAGDWDQAAAHLDLSAVSPGEA
jgi:hypothetical protein